MDLGLQNRCAIVAAASKGIGRAVATYLAQEGAQVVICGRNLEALATTAASIRDSTGNKVVAIQADLENVEQIQKLVSLAIAELSGVDILVTNCGGPPISKFEELNDDLWQVAYEQVLLSAVRLIRAVVPSMRQRGGGRIVNITSLSVKQPIPRLILSNAYRAAVVGMAKTLAGELACDNILVNNVCPGAIETERLLSLERDKAERTGVPIETIAQQTKASIPLGRYGQPAELAALVTFLVSNQASYITGTTIQCDGGAFCGLM